MTFQPSHADSARELIRLVGNSLAFDQWSEVSGEVSNEIADTDAERPSTTETWAASGLG